MPNPYNAKFPTQLVTEADVFQWSNNSVSSLLTAIGVSDLSLTVANGANFPTENFIVKIDDELIDIQSRSGNAMTVRSGGRGIDGSVAASHATGAPVKGVYCRVHHNQIAQEVIAIEQALGVNLSNIQGRWAFTTSGNFTVPVGVTSMWVILIGGGGGGAGGFAGGGVAGGGGGAGEVIERYLTGLTSGGTITCTRGLGGTGGLPATNGGNGGNTSITGAGISGTITARGGRGGFTTSGAGGASGDYSTGGAVNTRGGGETPSGGGAGGRNMAGDSLPGGGPQNGQSIVTHSGGSTYCGGGGGGCRFGIPGRGTEDVAATERHAAGWGAGGAGGPFHGSGPSASDGGNGAPGAIIFIW